MLYRTGKKIEDLYFGVCYWDPNHKHIVDANLFDFPKVQRNIAFYVVDKAWYKDFDPLFVCFNSVGCRCQYEMVVDGFPESNDPQKVDIYMLYVKPNREHLLSLVSQVSERQAKKWLKEYRKRYNKSK